MVRVERYYDGSSQIYESAVSEDPEHLVYPIGMQRSKDWTPLPGTIMKYVALLSGGKDSCYNLVHCARNGHELIAAASLGPEPGKGPTVKLIQTQLI